jgi:hypothetical protein
MCDFSPGAVYTVSHDCCCLNLTNLLSFFMKIEGNQLIVEKKESVTYRP